MVEDMGEYIEPTLHQHISWKMAIESSCANIQAGLLKHHEKYGTAIFRPVTVLSNSNAEQSIRMRIDDRIRKLQNLERRFCLETKHEERELIDDLIGYLINFRAYMATHEPEIWGDFE
jgi:hypothetical protein